MAQTPEREAAARGCLGVVAVVCLLIPAALASGLFRRRGGPPLWLEIENKTGLAMLMAAFTVVAFCALVGLLLVGRTKERPPYWREFLERERKR